MIALLLAAALAQEVTAQASDTQVYGIATAKCTTWNRHKIDAKARFLQLSFVNGYLTALSMENPQRFPPRTTVEESLTRIDWYCGTFPDWTVAQALAALSGELEHAASPR